jgi:hypothetical protein
VGRSPKQPADQRWGMPACPYEDVDTLASAGMNQNRPVVLPLVKVVMRAS